MQTPRQRAVIVAPEVAARIVARRVAGESLSVITGSLHLTPREVRAVLGAGPGGVLTGRVEP